MTIQIKTEKGFRNYLRKVKVRAKHHAPKVTEVISILAKEVWKRKEYIEVKEYLGETKNVAWVLIGGNWYCFSYSGEEEKIIMKKGSLQGEELDKFDNSDNDQSVKEKLDEATRIAC